ncbi:MAG: RluA family pseudouridine synthase [Dehalococcoidia bacterium]
MGTEDRTERRTLVAVRPGRADALLAEAFPDLTRARVQRRMEVGGVLLNGLVVRKSARVELGDELTLTLDLSPAHPAPVEFDIPVLYEDESLLAIDKPARLAVHGAPGDTTPSVAGWFAARMGDALTGFESEYPGVVHRLDKDTTGVLLLAKTPAAQAALSSAFEQRAAHKAYVAVCDGVPARREAVIDAPIARHPADRTRMGIVRHGRASRTHYEVLAQADEHAFVLVTPETGRTHQIRVHLAAVGIPVTFDAVYGKAGAGRQLLHAWRLEIPHPDGGVLTVTAPLPAEIVAFLGEIGLDDVASSYSTAAPASLTT